MDRIRNFSMKEFADFADSELANINDIQLLILKGHILVEYTLNCYLESISKSEESDFFKENFSFANKIKIAKHFGQLGSKNENLIKELTLLNKIRNDIAHSLLYNENHLEELFSELSKKSPNNLLRDKTKPFKARIINAISFITGAIFAGYKFYTDQEDLDNYIDGIEN